MRELAIILLEDENGISELAWLYLLSHLRRTHDGDIILAVKAQNGRFYLPENWDK